MSANVYYTIDLSGSSAKNLIEKSGTDIKIVTDTLQISGYIGEIKLWAGATIPDGFLLCDGSAKLRTNYKTLAAALGYTSGTNFYLPDLRNTMLKYKSGESSYYNFASGSSDTISVNQLPSHSHTNYTGNTNSGNIALSWNINVNDYNHSHYIDKTITHKHGHNTNNAEINLQDEGDHAHTIMTRESSVNTFAGSGNTGLMRGPGYNLSDKWALTNNDIAWGTMYVRVAQGGDGNNFTRNFFGIGPENSEFDTTSVHRPQHYHSIANNVQYNTGSSSTNSHSHSITDSTNTDDNSNGTYNCSNADANISFNYTINTGTNRHTHNTTVNNNAMFSQSSQVDYVLGYCNIKYIIRYK